MSTGPYRIIANQSIESRDLLVDHLLLWNLLSSSTPASSKGPSRETWGGGVGACSASHVCLYKLVPALSCTVVCAKTPSKLLSYPTRSLQDAALLTVRRCLEANDWESICMYV